MPQAQYETFPEHDGEGRATGRHRFRLRAANGEVVAQGTESYRDPVDAERGALDALAASVAAAGQDPQSPSFSAARVVRQGA